MIGLSFGEPARTSPGDALDGSGPWAAVFPLAKRLACRHNGYFMRWTVRTLVVIALLWLAYAAWPLLAVRDLAKAVQTRDLVGIQERVNFPALRQSLTSQIVLTYLQLTGREAKLGQLGRDVTVAAAVSIADPIVTDMATAEALAELMKNGWPPMTPERPNTMTRLIPTDIGEFMQVYAMSDHGVRTFEITLPPSAPADLQFKFQFRLTSWVWKLAGIELPRELRLRLAQELVKRIDKK